MKPEQHKTILTSSVSSPPGLAAERIGREGLRRMEAPVIAICVDKSGLLVGQEKKTRRSQAIKSRRKKRLHSFGILPE